jgi:L-ascorbate metabolism protein UlaG (beta-lactamase superfamily)
MAMLEHADRTRLRIRKVPDGMTWDEPLLPGVRLRIRWLGQAGFLIETGGARILIDPYLSDSLAKKYTGKQYPHIRMMPPPGKPEMLGKIDLYIVTHDHGDHLDPGTTAAIAGLCPSCLFIVPASSADTARERGVPAARLIEADAFSALEAGGIGIHPIPSAHEELSIDEAGHHRFLGYILNLAGMTLYHSGDCVPYPGIEKNLEPFHIDIALLPVNGRDAARKAANILGNFTLKEAVDLAASSSFPWMIGHHFGMFDFNTIDSNEARAWIENRSLPGAIMAEADVVYEFEKGESR